MVVYLGYFFFTTQHLLFAISYLRVALIFRLVFLASEKTVQRKILRRLYTTYAFAGLVLLATETPWLIATFSDRCEAAIPQLACASFA